MKYIPRILEERVRTSIAENPVTALLGPRQCGKSTLSKQIVFQRDDAVFLDLERPSDLQKLDDPEWFFTSQRGKLICLDEIQRKRELFPVIRSLVDEWEGSGHFLILGSASRDLLKQGSESLAGRISFNQLSPFTWNEIRDRFSLETYLVRGGFPRSLLANSDGSSFGWREDFITTFLERDLLQWSGFSPGAMRRLWITLAHLNGQVPNLSMIGSSLGISHTSVRNYLDLLSDTFMLSILPPYLGNTGKRLIRTPKVYLTDTGIIHALLGIRNFTESIGHPSFGAAWEALVLANLKAEFPGFDYYFYRTSHGSEIDILIEYHGKRIAIECKATVTPKLSPGTYTAIEDLKPKQTFVVCPVSEGWQMRKGIEVVSVSGLIDRLKIFGF